MLDDQKYTGKFALSMENLWPASEDNPVGDYDSLESHVKWGSYMNTIEGVGGEGRTSIRPFP
jgi:hypothetical protein